MSKKVTLSEVAYKELEELASSVCSDGLSYTLSEILEKAIDLLNAAEFIGDCSVKALDSEYIYRVRKDNYYPVKIE